MRRHTAVLIGFILTNACGGSTPTEPPPPAATASPAPPPTPTPNPHAAACGSPLPKLEEMYGFSVKVQLEPTLRKKILNASPFVRNAEYCAQVGLGGNFCETRIETQPTRVACDHYMSGISDEGGPGPNWFEMVDGKRVRCGTGMPGESTACYLKPENQYLLDVYLPGKYIACGGKGSNGTCGVCILYDEEYDPPNPGGTRRPGLCHLD